MDHEVIGKFNSGDDARPVLPAGVLRLVETRPAHSSLQLGLEREEDVSARPGRLQREVPLLLR